MRPHRSRVYLRCLIVLAIVSTFLYFIVLKRFDFNRRSLVVSSPRRISSDKKRNGCVHNLKQVSTPVENPRVLARATRASTNEELLLNRNDTVASYKGLNNQSSQTTVRSKDDVEEDKEHPACNIPQIDPFHNLALKEMRDVGKIDCPENSFSYVKNGSLIINADRLRYAHLQYIERPVGDDFQYVLSEPVQIVKPVIDVIQHGNVGCLVADKTRILEFEDGLHPISSKICTPESFLEIRHDGTIANLDGMVLAVEECSVKKCSMIFSFETDDPTRFRFEKDGRITHIQSSKCLALITDTFGDYDELVLLHDCNHPASRWTMHNYPEKGINEFAFCDASVFSNLTANHIFADVNIETRLTADFVKVSLIYELLRRTEYQAVVIPKAEFREYRNQHIEIHDMLNVALIVLESQSAANVQRKMPNAFNQIKSAENAFIFNGHAIVGDGTTDQLCAMLIGQLETDLPDALKSSVNSVSVDEWGFIFEDFRAKGYATLFTEDDPNFPAFNYRLNGFKNPPVDHYARVFWQCATTERIGQELCVGNKPYHKVNLDYTQSLFDAYEERPKFSVTVLSAESHNNINNIQYIEEELRKFLKNMENKGHLHNTFVFILGDHGLRASSFRPSFAGWLEERLPFFALLVPDAYLCGDELQKSAIQENAQYLTSHFDIYATLLDILSTNSRSTVGESLLKKIDHKTRTCEAAGVRHHWCPCTNFTPIDGVDKQYETIALSVVDYINAMIANETVENRCAKLEFEAIQDISYSVRSNLDLVDRYLNQTDYLLVISVAPSGGIYEASVTRENASALYVHPSISRLDLYGNQSTCIIRDHPNLRKFCFCKEFL